MATQEIKVTANRLGALIGKAGSTKREIEEKTEVSIRIDSEEGIVAVEADDPVAMLSAVEIVRAINRGFSPERAFRLLEDEDMMLDIIDLSDLAGSTRQMERLRGRIIGKAGASRAQIEDMTSTGISVHGKTVALIGLPENIKTARSAVEMLIQGVPHEHVYSFLDKKKKEAKQDMLEYYY
ncbi:RNA-processing protein [Methanoculleus sp. FWC-SCC1]|uniref:RNA-processing protein n=1 Tax=Methanoculleus frigidifontis TaxID=2584085 RepID=A0ABT8MA81_9EURY|nr:KH domain-containing protein [Methanoculleus sp. FWC-SCC1]MDN7024847.1 RNA-processing protein [Methanoculleus sp. FWC-SCC1]